MAKTIVLYCDAEIGKPGAWRGCRRRAAIARASIHGQTMTYCEKHKARAICPTREHFIPAPGSEPYKIV